MHRSEPFAERLAVLERFLGRRLPDRVIDLYSADATFLASLLPIATGREHDPPRADGSAAERFVDAQERLASVLGQAMGHRGKGEVPGESHIWPSGLLVLKDVGCGILHAVDLDDPGLRIIRYEHLDPTDEPDLAASGNAIAYREPAVPRSLQHRFTVIARSLEDWIGAQP